MIFLTRNGRRVPEAATDQPGTEMLVRTVSRYTDGDPINRPQVCVSPNLTAGSADLAQRMAEDLDRRGYLPPDPPMTREEFHALSTSVISGRNAEILWDVLGRGVPLGTAIERAGVPPEKRKGVRRAMKRRMIKLGWGESED